MYTMIEELIENIITAYNSGNENAGDKLFEVLKHQSSVENEVMRFEIHVLKEKNAELVSEIKDLKERIELLESDC